MSGKRGVASTILTTTRHRTCDLPFPGTDILPTELPGSVVAVIVVEVIVVVVVVVVVIVVVEVVVIVAAAAVVNEVSLVVAAEAVLQYLVVAEVMVCTGRARRPT